MGGQGSGRRSSWRWKSTVEHTPSIAIADLNTLGYLWPGSTYRDCWRVGTGVDTVEVNYRAFIPTTAHVERFREVRKPSSYICGPEDSPSAVLSFEVPPERGIIASPVWTL